MIFVLRRMNTDFVDANIWKGSFTKRHSRKIPHPLPLSFGSSISYMETPDAHLRVLCVRHLVESIPWYPPGGWSPLQKKSLMSLAKDAVLEYIAKNSVVWALWVRAFTRPTRDDTAALAGSELATRREVLLHKLSYTISNETKWMPKMPM